MSLFSAFDFEIYTIKKNNEFKDIGMSEEVKKALRRCSRLTHQVNIRWNNDSDNEIPATQDKTLYFVVVLVVNMME